MLCSRTPSSPPPLLPPPFPSLAVAMVPAPPSSSRDASCRYHGAPLALHPLAMLRAAAMVLPPPFIFSRCFAPLPWCSFPPLHPLAMLRTVAMVLPPFHSLAMVLAVTILLIPPPSSSRDTSCRYHGTHSPSFIVSRYLVPLPWYFPPPSSSRDASLRCHGPRPRCHGGPAPLGHVRLRDAAPLRAGPPPP